MAASHALPAEPTGDDEGRPGTSEDVSTDRANTVVELAESVEAAEAEAARRERRAGCASKAEKKAARKRQMQESWAKKKEAKKVAHKEAKTTRTTEWDALPADEQEAIRSAAREKRLRDKAAAVETAQAGPTPSRPMPACVIDLNFDHLMDERGITSLAQQVMFAYGANKRVPHPLRYLLTSASVPPPPGPDTTHPPQPHSEPPSQSQPPPQSQPPQRVMDRLSKMSGFSRWRLDRREGHYLTELAAERQQGKVVYLTSESEEVLQELDPTCYYVIGGLVDHNKEKGLTHRLATEAGLRTARLPIDEHMQMSQRRVLAVNHVFEILLHVANGDSWADALSKAVPSRRGAHVRGGTGDAAEAASPGGDAVGGCAG